MQRNRFLAELPCSFLRIMGVLLSKGIKEEWIIRGLDYLLCHKHLSPLSSHSVDPLLSEIVPHLQPQIVCSIPWPSNFVLAVHLL